MSQRINIINWIAAALAAWFPLCGNAAETKPNIVFFMADDLGFGDVRCYNPESSVPTPNIDSLAAAGTRYTDAHTPSAVCSPTRYSVMTGRYPWRDGSKGAEQGIAEPLLLPGQPTVASFLQQQGYRTAMIGKWHVGIRFAGDYEVLSGMRVSAMPAFDQPIVDGPIEHGFDYFFGTEGNFEIRQSCDFFMENRAVLGGDSIREKGKMHPRLKHVVSGYVSKDWKPEDLTRRPLEKALSFIDDHLERHSDQPFYLHFTPNAIHSPCIPNETLHGQPVKGRGGAIGGRGELIAETDIMLGALVDKLKQRGVLDNTLIVFTSDNGGMGDEVSIEAGHRFNGPWSGGKGSIFEGGHRVPFIVRYTAGGVKAGAVEATPVGLVDWFPSVAHSVAPQAAAALPPLDGEDRSAMFTEAPLPPRQRPLIHSGRNHVIGAAYPHPLLIKGKKFSCHAITMGGKKLVLDEDRSPLWLFDLETDPGETRNVLEQHPELAGTLLQQYRQAVQAVPER